MRVQKNPPDQDAQSIQVLDLQRIECLEEVLMEVTQWVEQVASPPLLLEVLLHFLFHACLQQLGCEERGKYPSSCSFLMEYCEQQQEESVQVLVVQESKDWMLAFWKLVSLDELVLQASHVDYFHDELMVLLSNFVVSRS